MVHDNTKAVSGCLAACRIGAVLVSLALLEPSVVAAAYGVSGADILRINPDPQTAVLGSHIAVAACAPAAMMQNPAAAAAVVQPQFSVTTTALGEGVNYHFIGAVLPTRIGSFGAALGYCGYGTMNSYLNDGSAAGTVTAAETVLAANYALSLKKDVPLSEESARIGCTIKSLQSELASATAHALAVDIAAVYHLPWVDRLSAGVAWSSLGDGLTYMNRTAALPARLTGSLAYAYPYWWDAAFSLDVSREADAGTYAYAGGVSVSPVYPVTVRLGWREEAAALTNGFRAGVGFDFGEFSLQYAYQPLENLSAAHTVGLTMAFGRILEPKTAYDHYLRFHYEQARRNYARKDYIIARQQLEEILSMYPEHQASKELLQKIGEALETADLQKSTEIERWMRKAQVALSKNDLLRARRYYNYVLGIDPENAAATVGLGTVEQLIAEARQVLSAQEQRAALSKLWEQAMAAYTRGDFVTARDRFDEIRSIDPSNEKAGNYLAEISTQLQKISSLQVNDLFLTAMELYNKGNYREAQRYFGAVVTADPQRKDAEDYYQMCANSIQAQEDRLKPAKGGSAANKAAEEAEASFSKAVSSYENGDYDEALRSFARSRDIAARHGLDKQLESAKQYIVTIRRQLAEHHFAIGSEYLQKGKLEAAAGKFRKALDYNPDYTPARTELSRLTEQLAQSYYEQGMRAFAAGDAARAKDLIRKSLSYDPKKPEAIRAWERIK